MFIGIYTMESQIERVKINDIPRSFSIPLNGKTYDLQGIMVHENLRTRNVKELAMGTQHYTALLPQNASWIKIDDMRTNTESMKKNSTIIPAVRCHKLDKFLCLNKHKNVVSKIYFILEFYVSSKHM